MTEKQNVAADRMEGAFAGDILITKPWVLAFMALGVFVRLARYVAHYPFTGDESRLMANFVDADYASLTRPLQYNQVAPIPFLWLERFLMTHLGFHEIVFRLPLIVAGIASVVLFAHVARRMFNGRALVLAVGVFSVAYCPIRYSAEIKPYGLDLLVSLGLLSLAVEWWHSPDRSRWLWMLALATPLALVISFPAVFVAGAISVGLLGPVWRRKNSSVRVGYVALNIALVGGFLMLLRFVLASQYSGVRHDMVGYWTRAFPPVLHPLRLAAWLVSTFTGEVMAYPVGSESGGGTFGLAGFVLGLIVIWRTRWRWFAITTLAMILLGLAGAAAQRYPFGGHPKLTQYLSPAICLAIGAGIAQAISWIRTATKRQMVMRWTLIVLFVIGIGCAFQSLAKPYKGPIDELHRGFAKWFWREKPEMQYVCIDLDLHQQIYKDPPHPFYVCYMAEFSRQHGDAAQIVAAHTGPLRCVLWHAEGAPVRQNVLDAWLDKMRSNYVLTARSSYRIAPGLPDQSPFGVYEAYDFTPRVEVN